MDCCWCFCDGKCPAYNHNKNHISAARKSSQISGASYCVSYMENMKTILTQVCYIGIDSDTLPVISADIMTLRVPWHPTRLSETGIGQTTFGHGDQFVRSTLLQRHRAPRRD